VLSYNSNLFSLSPWFRKEKKPILHLEKKKKKKKKRRTHIRVIYSRYCQDSGAITKVGEFSKGWIEDKGASILFFEAWRVNDDQLDGLWFILRVVPKMNLQLLDKAGKGSRVEVTSHQVCDQLNFVIQF
jgi:hypothetical protein